MERRKLQEKRTLEIFGESPSSRQQSIDQNMYIRKLAQEEEELPETVRRYLVPIKGLEWCLFAPAKLKSSNPQGFR